MKKCVLFDLDDTLYSYEIANAYAMTRLYETFNRHFPIQEQEFNRLYKLAKDEVKRELAGTASSHNRILYMQRLIEKTHKTVVPEIIMELYHAYWDNLVEKMEPFPEAIPVLEELNKKSVKVALVTNLTTYVQIRKMNKLKIGNYIDVLITSEEAGVEKPHPAIFLMSLNKVQVSPADAIMVGDSVDSDIEGANASGIDSVLLDAHSSSSTEKYEVGDSRRPKFVINNLNEVLNLLD